METVTYTLEQLLDSRRFRDRKDALAAALPLGEYTIEEAEAALKEFLERSVE